MYTREQLALLDLIQYEDENQKPKQLNTVDELMAEYFPEYTSLNTKKTF
jgi:hypothetical protein